MTLEFRNVSFHYQASRPLLKSLTFSLSGPEFLLIVGQNGVGKSTLLKLANGILKPVAGEVTLNGASTIHHSTSRLAREICVTFQNPADQIFAPTVRQEVEFGPRSLKRPDASALCNNALEACGLKASATLHPYDLPPAQRKLLTVASAVASGAPLLAFDEPSAGLSHLEVSGLDALFASLRGEGRGVVVVSHDLELFLRYAGRVLVLGEGKTLFYGETGQFLENEGFLRRAGLKLPTSMRLAKILQHSSLSRS